MGGPWAGKGGVGRGAGATGRPCHEAQRCACDPGRRRWELLASIGGIPTELHSRTHAGTYYGGEPAVWSKDPAIPREARFEVMRQQVEQQQQKPPPLPGQQRQAAAKPAAAAAAAASSRPAGATAGMRAAPKHPLANIGGHQLHHLEGSVGGAKGVGLQGAGGAASKRKRGEEGGGGGAAQPLSKEEAEALARREAARQRVAQRTAATFGLS